MNIPVPRRLDPRQPADQSRGLSLSTPSAAITASTADDSANTIELNGTEHRVPSGWQLAEGKHAESDLAILRRGSEVRVLAGDREGKIHEILGHSAAVRRSLLELRFGEESEPTNEAREVDRLVELSATIVPDNSTSSNDATEVDRLVKISDQL